MLASAEALSTYTPNTRCVLYNNDNNNRLVMNTRADRIYADIPTLCVLWFN